MHRRRFCNQWTLQKYPSKPKLSATKQDLQTPFSPSLSLSAYLLVICYHIIFYLPLLLFLLIWALLLYIPFLKFSSSNMMTAGATSCGARDHRSSPFTATQWQELEHQALIFKYMVSGVPIPAELIYSVKRSLDSSLASRLFPPQPIGWGCFQVGFGRKADPEPGRCRRTDGKKWRCSKEAYPESKYCERHMHRGRNRSRKHVEAVIPSSSSSASPAIPTAPNTSPSLPSFTRNISMNTPNTSSSSSSSSYSFSPISSSISPEIYAHQDPTHKSSNLNPFLYSHSSLSSSRPPGNSSGLSTHDNVTTHHLFLDSGSCSQPDKDYRYFHGIRESVDERAFFPEASGSRSFQDSCQPLMTMEDTYKYSHHHQQFQTFSDTSKQQDPDDQQHCFVLGTDFKSARSMKIEKEDETQKPLHHFFEEWPPKNTDSWLDLSSNSRIHPDS